MESTAKDFQCSLLNEISKLQKDTNICLSPVSIFLAVSLCAQGAQGKTLEEMVQLLIKKKPLAELTKAATHIMSSMVSSETVKIANAVMTKVKPTEEFVQSCKAFDAMIDKLVSVEQVNNWCSEKTNGKIKQIIDSIANIDMIILNAVYFLGKWMVPFQKHLIKPCPFTNSKGEKKNVPMLYGELKNTLHYKDEKMQLVQLYYKEHDLSAIVIMPNSMTDYLASVNGSKIIEAIQTSEEKTVKLHMPKFKIEFSTKLEQILPALGMQEAFTGCADFSKITKEVPLHISDVIHKTFINVDEEGTEAAAVTGIAMMRCCMMEDISVHMMIDKPFLFMIQSSKVPDLFLFTTVVNDIA